MKFTMSHAEIVDILTAHLKRTHGFKVKGVELKAFKANDRKTVRADITI